MGVGARIEITMGVGTGDAVGVRVSSGVGVEVGVEKGVSWGCMHAANNVAPKARVTNQCDLITMVTIVAFMLYTIKPRIPRHMPHELFSTAILTGSGVQFGLPRLRGVTLEIRISQEIRIELAILFQEIVSAKAMASLRKIGASN